MILLTADEMQKVDEKAIDLGMPELILMETAGRSVAARAYSRWQDMIEGEIVILVGGGNNGGDGLVAARYLNSWGAAVRVIMLKSPSELSGVNKQNYRMCELNNVNFTYLEEQNEDRPEKIIANSGLIIDAILGTGLTGDVRGKAVDIIQMANGANSPILAVDIPSGINATTGEVLGTAIKADLTVTMQNAKIGHELYPGRFYRGELMITDLGFPAEAYKEINPGHFRLTDREALQLLPERSETGHKGTFGRVLVIAGSKEMPGAAILTAVSCMKAGAGLVQLAVPEEITSSISSKAPEIVLLPLEADDGQLGPDNLPELKNAADKADIIAVGPGLGQGEAVQKLMEGLMNQSSLPMIIDADGINNLPDLEKVQNYSQELILTPHPGEMGRILDKTASEIVDNRVQIARDFAREKGVVLVLKGADTLTALPAGEIFVNPTGNEGMGTAGSGDVLTGLAAGLWAQNLSGEKAACLANYLHGRAGDLAKEDKSGYALTSGDLLEYLGRAFNSLFKDE